MRWLHIITIIVIIVVIVLITFIVKGNNPLTDSINKLLKISNDTGENMIEDEVFYFSMSFPSHPYIYSTKEEAIVDIDKMNNKHNFNWRLATKEELYSSFIEGAHWNYAGIVSNYAKIPLSPYNIFKDGELPKIKDHSEADKFGAVVYGKKPFRTSNIATYILPFNDDKWSKYNN